MAQAQTKDVSALEQALCAADDVGLCDDEVASARERLTQIRACLQDLRAAQTDGDVEKLQNALRAADDMTKLAHLFACRARKAYKYQKQLERIVFLTRACPQIPGTCLLRKRKRLRQAC